MDDFGERLRACAQEMGLTDAEVARRLDVSQQRYANYVSGRHRPDYEMLIRICRILGTRPDRLLGFDATEDKAPDTDEGRLYRRICVVARSMRPLTLRHAAAMMDALAECDEGIPEE